MLCVREKTGILCNNNNSNELLKWNCTEIGHNCVIFDELNFRVFQLEAIAIFLLIFSLNLYDLVYTQ